MKPRNHKHDRTPVEETPCEPAPGIVERSLGSLDEGLTETFPASDPVSISCTRIEEPAIECPVEPEKPAP